MDQYDNQFAEDNVYGHIVELLGRFSPTAGKLFLDFGCGYGRIAEVVRDRFGLHYVGFDVSEASLASLRERGFETRPLDFRQTEQDITAAILEQVAGRDMAALCIIDTLEHLAEPVRVLRALRAVGQGNCAPLLVSLPNIAHRDIGLKLAVGMFDYTEAGLLDHTHLQYFTAERMGHMLESSGWHEVHGKDVLMHKSDQHFPADHAVLSEGAPLHQYLATIRENVDKYDTVNQFVRAYLPGPFSASSDDVPYLRGGPAERPFLTVVTRTQGTRIETLRETLLCLSAQTCQDFEVVVVGHDLDVPAQLAVERVIADLHDSIRDRVRMVRVYGGSRATPLNSGFEHANGRYVAVLDDDDLVFGNWVETFESIARHNNGQLLRLVAVAQDWDKVSTANSETSSRAVGGMRAIYAEDFDMVAHIVENRSPLHSLAFPRSVFNDMKVRFDDNLTTAEDWDFIMRVVPMTGVATSKVVGCIYRLWTNSANSFTTHHELEWRANYFYTLRKLNKRPLLMPVGSVSRLREMYLEIERLRPGGAPVPFTEPDFDPLGPVEQDVEYLEILRLRYHTLIHSASWRATSPLRSLVRIAKRLGREVHPRIWQMNITDLEYHIRAIEQSTSWRVSRPLRMLRRTTGV